MGGTSLTVAPSMKSSSRAIYCLDDDVVVACCIRWFRDRLCYLSICFVGVLMKAAGIVSSTMLCCSSRLRQLMIFDSGLLRAVDSETQRDFLPMLILELVVVVVVVDSG